MDETPPRKFSLAKLTISKQRSYSSKPSSPDTAPLRHSSIATSKAKPSFSHLPASQLISEAVTRSMEFLTFIETLKTSIGAKSTRSWSNSATQTTEDKGVQIGTMGYGSPGTRRDVGTRRVGTSGKGKKRLGVTPGPSSSRTDDIFASASSQSAGKDYSHFTSSINGPLLSGEKEYGMGTWVFEVPEELHFSSLEDPSGNSDTLEADDFKLQSLMNELHLP